MTQVTFVTDVPAVDNEYHRFVANVLQEVTNLINAFKLLDLPSHITVKFRTSRFDDDCDDGVAVAQTSVETQYIEMLTSAADVKYLIESFIHELVHIQQGHLGHLRVSDDGRGFIWFDRYYSAKPLPHNEYLDLPWEVEAFREQKTVWDTITPHLKRSLEDDDWIDDIPITIVS